MGLRHLALIAATVAATFAGSALAQESDPFGTLRGGIDEAEAVIDTADDKVDVRPTVADDEAELVDDAPASAGVTTAQPPSSIRVQRQGPVDTTDPLAEPVSPRRVMAEEDPFAPLGLRLGSFIWYPAVDLQTGYTNNATNSAGGKAAAFGAVIPELLIRSDWARHEATLLLRGSYTSYTNDAAENQPTADVEATQQIDIAERWTLDFLEAYHFDTQEVSDPDFPRGATDTPGVHNYQGEAALTGAFGRNVFEATGFAHRTTYEDAKSDGKTIDQSDRDNTNFGAKLRYGYELSGTLTPFVEGEVNRRVYDRRVDDDGVKRSSWGDGLRAGFVYNAPPVLTAELGLGYRWEYFDDDQLATLSAPTIDGSVIWSPTPLATLTGFARTELRPTTDRNSSGSVVYDSGVDLAYAWRSNATLNLIATAKYERFQGTHETDRTYQLGISNTWFINRYVRLTGGYTHEWLDSSERDRDYESDTVRLDLRLQR